ncbi:MAG: hypothetical protein U0527_02430 [Candidatus Eisenbacteria bacterium]
MRRRIADPSVPLRAVFACLLLALLPVLARAYGTPDFPCPPSLQPRVEFWIKIFAQVSGNERVLHDSRYPWIVYETIAVPDLTQDEIKARLEARKKYYRTLLEKLAVKDPAEYDAEEARVAALFADSEELAPFTRAKERVRSQPGVREAMRDGIVRAGRYRDWIAARLDALRLPVEISFLPYLESSPHPRRALKAGAVRTLAVHPGPGRQFMQVEDDLRMTARSLDRDRRSRPLPESARDNLDSWPLAIVSYNHGVSGIGRAIQTLRHDRHRAHHPRVRRASPRLRLAELLLRVPGGGRDRQLPGEVLRRARRWKPRILFDGDLAVREGECAARRLRRDPQ